LTNSARYQSRYHNIAPTVAIHTPAIMAEFEAEFEEWRRGK